MTPVLVLMHGWGFDRALWDGLVERLGDLETRVADLGYFGCPEGLAPFDGRPAVAVGHSLGLIKLMELQPAEKWVGMVSIAGFSRFVEAPDFRPAIPARVLQRMIGRLSLDPVPVLSEFRRRCGAAMPHPHNMTLDLARLGQDLSRLAAGDIRPMLERLRYPVLALSAADDLIVPPDMADHALDPAPYIHRFRRRYGGHVLPASAPDWCAFRIRRYLERLG